MLARNSLRRPFRKRLAKDDEVSDEKMEMAITFLTNRLSEEDMLRFKQILQTPNADNKADNTPTEDTEGARAMQRTGGSIAGDSRGNSFGDRFPDAMKIKQGY